MKYSWKSIANVCLFLLLASLCCSLFIACDEKENLICPECSQKLTGDIKFCSNCGIQIEQNDKEGTPENTSTSCSASGHNWEDATCTVPKTCTSCKETQGAALGHNWNPATKNTPKTCSVCQTIDQQDEIIKNWFVSQYNLAQIQYISSLETNKAQKQNEITKLELDIDYQLNIYTQERSSILKRYPPCETRNIMLTNAQQNYAAAIKPYKDKMSGLEAEIATINAEITNPNTDNILSIVANNCNMSSIEIYQYYSQYKNCI